MTQKDRFDKNKNLATPDISVLIQVSFHLAWLGGLVENFRRG
jgi:hypothetical protein